jgi:hypothetical protein
MPYRRLRIDESLEKPQERRSRLLPNPYLASLAQRPATPSQDHAGSGAAGIDSTPNCGPLPACLF